MPLLFFPSRKLTGCFLLGWWRKFYGNCNRACRRVVSTMLVKLPLGSFPAANPAAAGTTWSRHLAGGLASPPNLKYRSQPPPLT